MKKISIVLLVVLFSTLAPAAYGLSLYPVKGKIHVLNSNIDLSRLKVVQGVNCISNSWSESPDSCGVVSSEAKVSSTGEFNLPGVKGKGWRWYKGFYHVYLDDKIIFSNRYPFQVEKKKSLKRLLENFTIQYVDGYDLNLETDNQESFEVWNNASHFGLDIHSFLSVKLMAQDEATKALYDLIRNPDHDKYLNKNHVRFDPLYFMYPGSPADAATKYKFHFKQRTSMMTLSEKLLALDLPDLHEELSHVTLKVRHINGILHGLWKLNIGMSQFKLPDGTSFSFKEPVLLIEATCEDEVLSGKITVKYFEPHATDVQELRGVCKRSNAEFDLTLNLTESRSNSDAPERTYLLNGRVQIGRIFGPEGFVIHVLDLGQDKKFRVYGSAHQCKEEKCL